MKFSLHPILSEMKEFYQLPLTPKRFQVYLDKLQEGSKGDMKLPIGSYNPMAKDHLLDKISELEAIGAEDVAKEALKEIGQKLPEFADRNIMVVLNIADDLMGGWTNRYATDFDSKFKINAHVNRSFCAPHLWTGEDYTQEVVISRTQEYACRTAYWILNSRLQTLEDHVKQEVFVANKCESKRNWLNKSKFDELSNFYEQYKESDDYGLIFNFFYGDEASESLSYPRFGINNATGFDYAAMLK